MKVSFLTIFRALIFGLVSLLTFKSAHALTQFRCSGQIQYRPCDDDRAIPALLAKKESSSKAAKSMRAQMKLESMQPTVFSTKYKYNEKLAVGVWTGFVHGEGPIVLRLRLNVPGSPPETRYMGKANLRGRPSPFEFRSSPPKGGRWNWYISAKNEANS